jgi:hypothetical protein
VKIGTETTREVVLSRTVDCGQYKYLVHIDSGGITVFAIDGNDLTVLRFVDVLPFHAAAIADAITTLTAEYAADLAKLRNGGAA